MYLPPAFCAFVFISGYAWLNRYLNTFKMGHDFVPIYDDKTGSLRGFTHPTLVQAAQNLREAENAKTSGGKN
jgi:hypothetical protein